MWDAGSRQRRHRILHRVQLRRWRHRILHRVQLRRYQGELTGYSFQVRLFICGALRERRQHSRVLLLRQLNILQRGVDGWLRYRGGSRLMWRQCNEAVEIRQGEVRQREAIEIRQREIRQREAIEVRQREIRQREIRQRIGGGRANDGQGGQGYQYRWHSTRSPLLCRLRLFLFLCFFVRCFSHLRSLRISPVARFFLAADQENKKAVAWRSSDASRAIAHPNSA